MKWYNVEKGFGFITPDDGYSDVFVVYTDLPDNPRSPGFKVVPEKGQRVSFEIIGGDKGPRAISVVLVELLRQVLSGPRLG